MARLSPLIIACLAATWLIWGSTYLAIRFALPDFPPYWQMSSRFIVAGSILLLWCKWRGAKLPSAREWRNAFIVGGLMLGGGMGNTAFAERTVASGLIVVFVAIIPALIALLNLAYGIRPTRIESTGIVLGLIGVVMLMRGQGFAASPSGLLAMCIATLCWSAGSVLSQQNCKLASGSMGFASEMLAGSVVLLLMSWLAQETPSWSPTPKALWAWWYLIVFGSLLAFNAYMVLLARASAALAASYTFVNPLIALLLGIYFGGEAVSTDEWWATAVIIAAVVLLVLGRRRAT